MSVEKVPLSLRAPARVTSTARGKSSSTAGVITAACIVTTAPMTSAIAQNAAQGQLPALNVEAPAEVKKKPQPRRQSQKRSAAPRAAQAPAALGPATAAPSAPAVPGNANPNADPAAPYKVDRSANTKLTQPILNQPRTITVIPKEVIEDKGATSFRDLLRTTPGVTLGSGEGGNAYGDRMFIRGFDARNDVYVDGVRDPGVAIRENFATEQVEILKGPASTVGGRGTAGGAINVVTKKASFTNFYNAEATLGTDQTRRVTADVNQVLSPDFAIRLNGMWQEANVAGRDYVFDDRWGGLITATWKPTDTFKATADYYHLDLNGLPDWGVPFDARIKRPFTESGLRRDNYYGIPNRDFQTNTQDIASGTVEYKFSEFVTLTNKLRYGLSVLDYVAGAPGTPNLSNANPALWTVPSNAKSRFQINEILANQTDLNLKFNTGFVRHEAIVGAEFSQEDVTRDTYTGLATESFGATPTGGVTLNLWNPNAGAIPFNNQINRRNTPTDIQVRTNAFYALDTLNFHDQFFITGGIRVDDYRVSATSYFYSGAVNTALSRHDTMINWNAGVTYKPVPFGSFYAAYGTSSNPVGSELDGSANDYGGLTAANAVLGPELNTSMEVGTKWEVLDRHLLLTAALFQNDKRNAREQIGATVLPTGAYVVRGLDLGATGKITPKWSIYGGVVLMDSEVTESAVAANIGRPLANIAHQSFSLLTKYDLNEYWTVGGQATYKSQIYGGTLAANENILPESWRFDLLAEYRVSKIVTAKFKVLNITDAVIYDAFYRSATPYVFMAPGRAAYVSIEAKL